MRYTKPTNVDLLPYSTVKIDGCSEAKLGFDFLSEQPSIGKRRYCNKVLVHECISVPESEPLDVTKAELLVTSDPCYHFFEIYKATDDSDESITLQLNGDDLTIGVLIDFTPDDTCGLPQIMAYRLYVTVDDERILMSQGNFCITPCCCSDDDDPVW